MRKASGDVDGAVAIYREALPRAESVLGAHDQTTVYLANSLGLTLMQRGELEEAATLMDRVLAAYDDKKLAQDKQSYYIALQNRGAIALNQRDYPRAEAWLREAADGQRALFGGSGAMSVALTNPAKTLIRANRPAEAPPLLAQALPMSVQYTGEHSPQTLGVYQTQAEAALAQKNPKAAEPLVQHALDTCLAQFGAKHPMYAVSLGLEARLRLLEGRKPEAAQLAEQSEALLLQAGSAGKLQLPQIEKLKDEIAGEHG